MVSAEYAATSTFSMGDPILLTGIKLPSLIRNDLMGHSVVQYIVITSKLPDIPNKKLSLEQQAQILLALYYYNAFNGKNFKGHHRNDSVLTRIRLHLLI